VVRGERDRKERQSSRIHLLRRVWQRHPTHFIVESIDNRPREDLDNSRVCECSKQWHQAELLVGSTDDSEKYPVKPRPNVTLRYRLKDCDRLAL
jgi:hypothetical protein